LCAGQVFCFYWLARWVHEMGSRFRVNGCFIYALGLYINPIMVMVTNENTF
jgi:hypothetical protein